MAFTKLDDVNRPKHSRWPLCGSEAAYKKLSALLVRGSADGA